MLTLATFFGGPPEAHASAPGRINLLGEHTDYNDGFMLPVATPQLTEVAISPSIDDCFHVYSATLDEGVDYAFDAHPPQGFASYVDGCVRLLAADGVAVPPLRVYISTELPVGAGMSSSAALEVATLRALRSLLSIELDDVRLARLAQRAEIDYAKVNCGIMDQMASSLADQRHMLFIDARSLAHRLLPMPRGSELIVIDSGVPRTLAASAYNVRRAECEEASRLLGVAALRDVTDPASVETLPSPYRERARHVVRENLRVLEASAGVSAARFGALMSASHASLRDDFAVSIPELDTLAAFLADTPGVYGARLTGAGFGGACVALCREGCAEAAAAAAAARYNATGRQGRVLIPRAPQQGGAP
ncbi:galactokinase [Massilia psychrophila]|uniref:Galactokinase n=1 Tax=Massilia psychrophila TaxID=1603353 RepID=A0A2G8SZ72_9BURK|nr:galactokinase [Massilia psychrophila]PIL38748.1 galactokinase [Massilia psychrophila]GGE88353.1 galactokinase [Massilia psychrophila]